MSTQEKIMAAGKVLYMLSVPNQEIARTLDVSDTTVSNWVGKGGWRDERVQLLSKRKARMDMMGDLIDFQLEALHQRIRISREFAVQTTSGQLTPIDKGEIDALTKMFSAIKGKELTWGMYVTVIREFCDYLSKKSPDLAKAIIPHTDDFLNGKRETLNPA